MAWHRGSRGYIMYYRALLRAAAEEVGFSIDVGRPGVGTKLSEVNRIIMKLAKVDVEFEPMNTFLIDKKPVLIDFERAYYTKKPKNLTQFCQFLMRLKIISNWLWSL